MFTVGTPDEPHGQVIRSRTKFTIEPASHVQNFVADASRALTQQGRDAQVVPTGEPGVVEVVIDIPADRLADAERVTNDVIGRLMAALQEDVQNADDRAEIGSNLLIPA